MSYWPQASSSATKPATALIPEEAETGEEPLSLPAAEYAEEAEDPWMTAPLPELSTRKPECGKFRLGPCRPSGSTLHFF